MLKQTVAVTAEWAASQDAGLWLTGRERTQWRSFFSARRRADWLAGRLAVKRLLQGQWGLDPLSCEVGTEGVAPFVMGKSVPAINLSLSHSAGQGAASWHESAQGTVGVDIQRVRPVRAGLAARILSHHEWAQTGTADDTRVLLFWALKEAAIKAGRRPFRHALRVLEVTLTEDGTARIILPGTERVCSAEYVWTDGAWLARAVLPPAAG